jgi:hypothetical protein
MIIPDLFEKNSYNLSIDLNHVAEKNVCDQGISWLSGVRRETLQRDGNNWMHKTNFNY